MKYEIRIASVGRICEQGAQLHSNEARRDFAYPPPRVACVRGAARAPVDKP